MQTTDYEVYRALAQLTVQELRRQARSRHAVHEPPGWPLSPGRRLCGWLGAWLMALGRKLQAFHRPQSLPLEQT